MSASPVAALWRLHPYLRPYRYRLALLLLAAMLSTGTEIVIPLIAKVVIDGAIAHHERALLLPLGLLAVGLGAAGAALSLIRRWGVGNAVAGMEQSIRDDLYQHLQRLDPAFHDEWQSGQLLSRATTDLSSIRRFAGFGLVFIFISIMTFAAVTGLLISLNWWLGLITAVLFAPVLVFCTRFERRYKVLARRSQDQDGDLTTLIEEASTGVRVLKSLGRGPEASQAHLAQAAELGHTRIEMAVVDGVFWSTLNLVPNAAIAISVVLGAFAISHHSLSIGGLVAFITLALQLVWPVEALGYILASGEEAATAAQRVLEIFDAEPTIRDESPTAATVTAPSPAAARRAQLTMGRGATGPFDMSMFAFLIPVPPHRSCGTSTCTWRRARPWCWPGPPGPARRRCCSWCPRLADATGGRVLVSGADVRDVPLAELRAAVGCAFEEATLFSASVLENVTFGAADGDRRRGRGGADRRAGPVRLRPALGARHPDRRAGHGAVGRAAAAGRARPRDPGPAAGADPRRPAVGARRAHRGAGDPGPARDPGRRHRARGGAPAVHGRARGPGRAA